MWTEKEQALLERFDATFPAPHDDNNCRVWTRRLAEQFAFTFPAAGWGTKQASPSRPPSTDCICTKSPFIGYDVLVSQGTSEQALAKYPEPLPLDGQVFISVAPTNHLGAQPGPTPPPTCQFPPRDQGLAFFTQLDDKYRVRGYQPTTYYVDKEGTSVWYAQYLLYRTQGLDHAAAQAKVFAEIDAIWNP